MLLAAGILMNPGVTQHTYQTYNKRYIEKQLGRDQDNKQDDTTSAEDEESGLVKRKSFKERL